MEDGPKNSTSNFLKVLLVASLGLRIYGKNWKKIEQLVSTRTGTQIRSHAQKFFLKSKQPAATESQELSQICSDFVDEH
jgi:SHAQKYF class myb-like DNA-binding protein